MEDEAGLAARPRHPGTSRLVYKGSRRESLLIPVIIIILALTGSIMLLAVTFMPLNLLDLCHINLSNGGGLSLGVLGFCSQSRENAAQDCFRQLGLNLDDTTLLKGQKETLDGNLLLQMTYVMVFHPIAGGLVFLSCLFTCLGHFLKTTCFVFFGEGNVLAFGCMTIGGIAGLVAFAAELAFLVHANANLEKAEKAEFELNVLAVALTLAGTVLVITTFILYVMNFNKSISSGVVEQLAEADTHSQAEDTETETDFWTDGEHAERNERLMRAREEAEKQAAATLKAKDLKQMNDFLSRHQPMATGGRPTLASTPPLQPARPLQRQQSNSYSSAWNDPPPRHDVKMSSTKSPRTVKSPRMTRGGMLPEDEAMEMLDEVKPLDMYQSRTTRKNVRPPPAQTTSSRYSQNTGYLQSVAPASTEVTTTVGPVQSERERANAMFEKQKKSHQSIAPSSVYSQT